MVSAFVQMATLDKAEALLEDLRSASWDAAVKDLDEVKSFAAKQVCRQHTVRSVAMPCIIGRSELQTMLALGMAC